MAGSHLSWSRLDFSRADIGLKAAATAADPQLVINWSAID
jgi:hypothetical protein